MRIVAGRWRGRAIAVPAGRVVRPTADRVREAWMSIVHPWLSDARVLDLFAGSGALGLEALSRGARHADFVERAAPSLQALRANIATFDAGRLARVQRADALHVMAGLSAAAYDVAFADPPYGEGLAAAVAAHWLTVPFAAILGVEHAVGDAVPAGGATRRYGSTAVTIYRADLRAGDREITS
jgi:16S rRNA (guanine966-N2)-methyltransferase